MTSQRRVPILDGHNDVLLRLHRRGGEDPVRAFLEGGDKGHLDLQMACRGGFAGGLFAIFVPSPRMPVATDAAAVAAPSQGAGGDALPTSVLETKAARDTVLSMVALLLRIEREFSGSRSHLPGCRRYPGKLGPRRIGCCPSSGRRGSDRRELRIPGRSCMRPDFARSVRYGADRMPLGMGSHFSAPHRPIPARA